MGGSSHCTLLLTLLLVHWGGGLPGRPVTTGSMNSHYQSLLSLPRPLNLTTSRCCHYRTNEFSLPVAVVTTGPMNSHYQSLLSLPDQWILTTSRCCHYRCPEISLPCVLAATGKRSRSSASRPYGGVWQRPSVKDFMAA